MKKRKPKFRKGQVVRYIPVCGPMPLFHKIASIRTSVQGTFGYTFEGVRNYLPIAENFLRPLTKRERGT